MIRILLVEDDKIIRNSISNFLKYNKYDVTEAENGKLAQELLILNSFDIVISDALMPEMNGIDLFKWMEKEHATPFILMTGHSDLLDSKVVFSLNVDNFLMKPFGDTDLLNAIVEVTPVGLSKS